MPVRIADLMAAERELDDALTELRKAERSRSSARTVELLRSRAREADERLRDLQRTFAAGGNADTTEEA